MSSASMEGVCPLQRPRILAERGQHGDLSTRPDRLGSRPILMSHEPDPLQAQYDGIPVPCYTWRADGDGFVLERANRAAYQQAGGTLRRLLGRRLEEIYPDRPDIQRDIAQSLAEHDTV